MPNSRCMITCRSLCAAVALVLSAGSGCDTSETGTTYNLYFLGGQSNMDGFGYVSELPAEIGGPVPGVRIFHGNPLPDDSSGGGVGLWTGLRPGHGTGFSSDGTENSYGVRFGVEQTFALRLRELAPESNVAIVKYSRGGTSIDAEAARDYGSWDSEYGDGSGVNQYDHFLTTVQNALAESDIDGDGEPDTLVPAGIVWMQGESDATQEATAQQYEANLKRLIDLVRAALRVDDLPVVIGRISDSGKDDGGQIWTYGSVVRQAQADFCTKDACAALVTSTDGYGYSDKWHYDTAGYIDLGVHFADALYKLEHKTK